MGLGGGGNKRQASASKSCFHILHPTSAPGCCNSRALTLLSAPSPSQLSSVFDPPLTAALRAMFRRKPIAVGHPDLLQGVLRELSSRRRRHSRLRGRSSAAVPSATTAKRERPRRCAFACLPACQPACARSPSATGRGWQGHRGGGVCSQAPPPQISAENRLRSSRLTRTRPPPPQPRPLRASLRQRRTAKVAWAGQAGLCLPRQAGVAKWSTSDARVSVLWKQSCHPKPLRICSEVRLQVF